ncbi:MAG: hypothetical protein A3J92_03100 [Planctomycetes bacterium RIFOXYC2_FULL_41_27]|nr:MAG: hypothetical protein A2094_02370 [Planctomycetes bacterium GWE2_41_14]OHC06552.1 MAG: hypothetical protein A3J92_03100 [Planctomycetes bacterium RIFOXYC2_FULL_41_27]
MIDYSGDYCRKYAYLLIFCLKKKCRFKYNHPEQILMSNARNWNRGLEHFEFVILKLFRISGLALRI